MRLNRKIELLEPQYTRNDSGQKIPAFVSRGLISCDINNKAGIERYQSFMEVSQHLTLFTIRYNTDIQATWVINHNGIKYEIQSIIEESRLHFMHVIGRFRDNEQ